MPEFIQWLFASNSVQVWWYITRAAGIIAYILLWLSTAWGLAVSSKIFDPHLQRGYTYDFHQFLSLLALGFTGLHMAVLLFDHYLPFSLVQVLLPFTAAYKPFWVGIGVICFWLSVLVSVTFYLRGRIGIRAFRAIHLLSFVAFFGAALHGLFSGTDSSLPAMKWVYEGSFLSIVFLTVYWLVASAWGKRDKARRLPAVGAGD
jgi:predicted ferric reductase